MNAVPVFCIARSGGRISRQQINLYKGDLSVLIIVIRMWSRAGRYMAVGGQIRSSETCNMRSPTYLF